MAERINGIKVHLDRWSDEEIVSGIGHTAERRNAVDRDMGKLLEVAGMRGLVMPDEEPDSFIIVSEE